MTTKTAIIATAVVFVLAVVVVVVVIVLFIHPGAPRANQRAEMLGQGVAMACLIPLAVIWIAWAARVRTERGKNQAPRSQQR